MSKDFEFQIVTRDLSQFSKVYLVPIADLTGVSTYGIIILEVKNELGLYRWLF